MRRFLPRVLRSALFGDRERWGMIPQRDDPMWQEWIKREVEIYRTVQKTGLGNVVNEAGYTIMREVALAGKTILEVGPGDLPHHREWQGRPASYILVDQSSEFLASARERLGKLEIPIEEYSVDRFKPGELMLPKDCADIVLSFYSLEHLYPLETYVSQLASALKQGGLLVGSIPAEGGLAWGLGRLFTSRRWFRRHTTIDLDKIICWEHPNFADQILACLEKFFILQSIRYWPMRLPSIDGNLVVSFIMRKI